MTEIRMATGGDGQKRNSSCQNPIISQPESQGLCSGYGQFHSPHNKKNPQDYIPINLTEIEAMAENPPSVDKADAQWVIPSSLYSRIHSEQRTRGKFHALWCDIDETNGLSFQQTISRALCVVPDCITFTTKSATPTKQKTRIIVPLAEPIPGGLFVIGQKILNDKLETQGITPDRVTERAGQVCYLPNRGDFYQYHIDHDLGPLNIQDWSKEIKEERERVLEAERLLQERRKQARLKALKRIETGSLSPIDAFNSAYDLELVLESFGYVRRGNRYLSPLSESGVPGVVIRENKWFSAHGSDSDIGRKTSTGSTGDAFDLFTYFQHNNDRKAAIRAAGQMFTVNGIPITTANRRRYMESAHA